MTNLGTVQEGTHAVVHASGLADAMVGEFVTLAGGTCGVIRGLTPRSAIIARLDGDPGDVHPGDTVRGTGTRVRVPVGDGLRSRVIDPLGRPLDGRDPLPPTMPHRPVGATAPGVGERTGHRHHLFTGITFVELFAPVARGARVAVIGDAGTGKTDLLATTVVAQRDTGIRCVCALIGRTPVEVAAFAGLLRERGALAHTTVVAVPPTAPPAARLLAAETAMTIAEAERDGGADVVVTIDDMGDVRRAARELIAELQAVDPRLVLAAEVFAVEASLLDRAGEFATSRGGGTITALVADDGDDLPDPMSLPFIVDQTWRTDAERFAAHLRPAFGPSTASRLPIRPLRFVASVAGKQFGMNRVQRTSLGPHGSVIAAAHPDVRRLVKHGETMERAVVQPATTPASLPVIAVTAALMVDPLLNDAAIDDIPGFIGELTRRLESDHGFRIAPDTVLRETTRDRIVQVARDMVAERRSDPGPGAGA